MRLRLTLTLVFMIGIALPGAAHPLTLSPASAEKVEAVQHTVNGVRRRGAAKHGLMRYRIRRHPDDICSI